MTRRLQAHSRRSGSSPSTGGALSGGRRGDRSCSCGNTCQDCRARRAAEELPHAWMDPIPPVVHEALSSPGDPLTPTIRVQMESRFGHDFGKVRVHRDGTAAASATAVHARAYTVGRDIVLGSAGPGNGPTLPLLGHELSHVVQQERALRTLNHPMALQRSGLEFPSTSEGQFSTGSTAATPQAVSVPEPDCNTSVADMFLLGTIHCPQRPECCFAQVHYRKNRNLTGIFRADHQLEGKPDCDYGDQKNHDFWLANQWRILAITLSEMTVMNMCGREETLNEEGIGTVKGESNSAVFPGRAPTSTALPPNIVEHSQGMWGKTHKVHYDDQCNSIHFVPDKPGEKTRVYTWDPAQDSFVDADDPTNTKTPGQLEQFAGIVLKEYIDGAWQGKNCGDLPHWAL